MKNLMQRVGLIVVIILLSLFVLYSTGCALAGDPPAAATPESSGDAGGASLSNKQVLADLGFDLNIGEPRDDRDQPVGYRNPLGCTIKTIDPNNEIYLAGLMLNGSSWSGEALLQNPQAALEEIFSETYSPVNSEHAWMALPKKSLAADIDGDGLDEIITAVFLINQSTIQFHIRDNNGNLLRYSTLKGVAGVDIIDDQEAIPGELVRIDKFFMRDFTTGDFDNNGRPDFVISAGNTVLILDHNLTLTGSFTLSHRNTTDNPCIYLRVEAGDLNQDDYADLVVINGTDNATQGYLYVFKGTSTGLNIGINESNPGGIAVFDKPLAGVSTAYASGEAAIGDFNGDGFNDLFIVGLEMTTNDDRNCSFSLYSIADKINRNLGTLAGMVPDTQFIKLHSWVAGAHYPDNLSVPRALAGDFNGDGREEFMAFDLAYSLGDNGVITRFTEGPFNVQHDPGFHNGHMYDLAVTGDVTGDGVDDLVFIKAQDLPSYAFPGASSFNSFVVWGKTENVPMREFFVKPITCDNSYPTLALANTDSDSLVLRYSRRELKFSEPIILAALASPPYITGSVMDIGNSVTTLSYTKESGTTNTFTNGFYLDVTIGASLEWETGIGFELKYGRKLHNSWAWGFGETKALAETIEYTCSAGENKVLCTAIPMDVYIYDILVNPADSGIISDKITISVPRKPERVFITVDLYNSIVTEKDRFPDSIFKHRIGAPYTYYTKSEKETFEDAQKGMFSKSTQTVTDSGGGTGLSLEYGTTNTTSFEYNLGYGAYVGGKLVAVETEIEAGYEFGYTFEHSVSEGLGISGFVGPVVDSAQWGAKDFRWGIMMVPLKFPGQEFNLVTYWVE